MLAVITAVKLIAEIALMALFGQWLLGLLAGAKRNKNIFYQVLQILGRPFVSAARWVTPSLRATSSIRCALKLAHHVRLSWKRLKLDHLRRS